MNTPVVLIVFNRPELARSLFNIVKEQKPSKLFIVSDGPRNKEEAVLVGQTRAIFERADWECEVKRKYSQSNLGCRTSVSDGLDWVFSQVNRAIILEDDCMPDPSFFIYCDELLEKYKNDDKVMMISGNNFFKSESTTSYGFCRHSLIWGWATWKRAWDKYRTAEKEGRNELTTNFQKYAKLMPPVRLKAIKKTLEGKIDTWDYVWQLALLINNGLCAYPCVNLVRNTGFGTDATHTKVKTFHASLKSNPILFPLKHPVNVAVDEKFDAAVAKTYKPLFLLKDALLHFFR